MEQFTKRQTINICVAEMKNQRTQYEAHWRDISQYLLPYRLRLQLSEQNKGDRRNLSIYDSTAVAAVRTGEAGMMSGFTSPAKRWFRLYVSSDPEMVEFGPVKHWLDEVTNTMMAVFERSNTYITLPTLYGDMMGFGTGAMSVEEHFDTVIHTRVFPCGSYWIAQDDWGVVNVFYREFRMTVRQLYQRFGGDADYSEHVRGLAEQRKWEEWVDVGHIIKPNDAANADSPYAKDKKFYSCWYELGASSANRNYLNASNADRFLSESGFDSFPILVGRWKQSEGDVYGIDCPGMMAIGDIKTLQLAEKRAWQGVEKIVNPHWIAPTGMQQRDNAFLPGEVTWLDEREGMKGLRPAHELNANFLAPLEEKQAQVRQRINEAFHVPLFRMLEFLEDRERTATEIAERKDEKLTQLVPTIGQVGRGVHNPLIERTFEIMVRQQLVPPAPEELQGAKLDIEYLGVLAQAQKSVQIAPIERLATFVSSMAEVRPDILDKMDFDQAVDEVATALGVPAAVVLDDDRVAEIRAGRAQAMEQQKALEVVAEGSKAVKNLATSPTGEDNALTRLTGA